jgi:hypothetical protein
VYSDLRGLSCFALPPSVVFLHSVPEYKRSHLALTGWVAESEGVILPEGVRKMVAVEVVVPAPLVQLAGKKQGEAQFVVEGVVVEVVQQTEKVGHSLVRLPVARCWSHLEPEK